MLLFYANYELGRFFLFNRLHFLILKEMHKTQNPVFIAT